MSTPNIEAPLGLQNNIESFHANGAAESRRMEWGNTNEPKKVTDTKNNEKLEGTDTDQASVLEKRLEDNETEDDETKEDDLMNEEGNHNTEEENYAKDDDTEDDGKKDVGLTNTITRNEIKVPSG